MDVDLTGPESEEERIMLMVSFQSEGFEMIFTRREHSTLTLLTPLVIYVYTTSVTKRKEFWIPNDYVIVAKQIILVTIQIYWFRPENNVLLMLIDANR